MGRRPRSTLEMKRDRKTSTTTMAMSFPMEGGSGRPAVATDGGGAPFARVVFSTSTSWMPLTIASSIDSTWDGSSSFRTMNVRSTVAFGGSSAMVHPNTGSSTITTGFILNSSWLALAAISLETLTMRDTLYCVVLPVFVSTLLSRVLRSTLPDRYSVWTVSTSVTMDAFSTRAGPSRPPIVSRSSGGTGRTCSLVTMSLRRDSLERLAVLLTW